MFISNISKHSSKYRNQSLSHSESFTSLPSPSLRWFDVPNHFQPWPPHERQQALAVIGCWKNEWERGQERGKTVEKKRGGQGRNGEWTKRETRPQSSSFLFQGLMLSLALPSVLMPNYFPLLLSTSRLLPPAIYLNCAHSASTHWRLRSRNWFGDLRMPDMKNTAHWRAKECVSGKRPTK